MSKINKIIKNCLIKIMGVKVVEFDGKNKLSSSNVYFGFKNKLCLGKRYYIYAVGFVCTQGRGGYKDSAGTRCLGSFIFENNNNVEGVNYYDIYRKLKSHKSHKKYNNSLRFLVTSRGVAFPKDLKYEVYLLEYSPSTIFTMDNSSYVKRLKMWLIRNIIL
jgi:hypothetical protein